MRVAELQLKIIWEEILKRFEKIVDVAEPKRPYSSLIKGYDHLPVEIAAFSASRDFPARATDACHRFDAIIRGKSPVR
jgi:hypothetical protein